MSRARVVFMGTAAFAVPTLAALARAHEVVGVVTQPDRPAGRGRLLVAPPVKVEAERLGLPVLQSRSVKRAPVLEAISALRPEVIVVAAFGQLLPPALLDLPPRGCLNVHASLLPRHRGAAPVAAAILAGDDLTGVTIMLMDPGLDTGPILTRREEPIRPEDTTGTLTERLAGLGAELLTETLPHWLAGELAPRPQDEAAATYAPMLRKEQGAADWTLPALSLWRQCRAFNPWPTLYTSWGGRNLRILESRPIEGEAAPGQVRRVRLAGADWPAVGTAAGLLVLDRVQLEGRRAVSGREFLLGHAALAGARLGAKEPAGG